MPEKIVGEIMKYIFFDKRKGTYVLTKKVMGKAYNFGSYKSLEDARKARAYFEKNGWGKCLNERLKFTYNKPSYIVWLKSRKVYQIRKVIDGGLTIYGQFKTINEAEQEVELLKKYDWDIQALCDLSSDNKEIVECLRCGKEFV